MTEVTTTPASSNGAGTLDDQAVALIRGHVEQLHTRRGKLQTELGAIADELRRYERALTALTGPPPGKPGRRADRVRPVASRIGDERLVEIKEAILAYAAEHDEFRQQDIRAVSGHTSSVMSVAFEQLRQEPHNLIRLSRQSRGGPGSGKWFRLTASALKEQA